MPHDLATVEGQPAMAYQGQMPWHALGTAVQGTPTWEDMLRAAHLDWEVQLFDMYFKDTVDPFGEAEHDIASREFIPVPSRRSVVRWEEGHPIILGTVGTDYEPLQNRQAFGVLDIACREHGVTIETAGALGKGERVWMLAKLPGHDEVVPGDIVDNYFLISTGHDGATPYTGRPTKVRVVCANTLGLAVRNTRDVIRLVHQTEASKQLDAVSEFITDLIKSHKVQHEQFVLMAQTPLTILTTTKYIEAVLGITDYELASPKMKQRRDTILHLSQHGRGTELSKDTVWAAYNAVTEYFDHVRPAEAGAQRKLQANASALFGTNAYLKARALSLATDII